MDTQDCKVMVVGADSALRQILAEVIDSQQVTEVTCDFDALMSVSENLQPKVIICNQPPDGISNQELAQLLRTSYPQLPLFFVTSLRKDFDRKILKKNGFSDSFLTPFDRLS